MYSINCQKKPVWYAKSIKYHEVIVYKYRFVAFTFFVAFSFYSAVTPSQQNTQFVIVWDVGGVLATVNKRNMVFNDLGIWYILKTAWCGATPSKMRQWMYEALQQYSGPQEDAVFGRQPVDDDTGTIVPAFMAETWLCSHIPNNQILEHIACAVEQWNPTYPVSSLQRSLVKQTLMTALSAEVLGKNTLCIPAALALVKAFASHGVPQYILSNFEKEAFNIMLNNPHNAELFSYIPEQNRTISGMCKLAKPHHSIYKHFEAHHNLDSSHIIFIDDQLRNIQAARECGWTAIHLQKGNYVQLAPDLEAALTQPILSCS